MLPFTILGAGTALYMLWALIAYPVHIFVKDNSIVYVNAGTDNDVVAALYLISTCGSLFFSRIRDMVIFGAVNLIILLTVMAVRRYAFTSLWCAYAAVASVIILEYFWKSRSCGRSCIPGESSLTKRDGIRETPSENLRSVQSHFADT